MVRTTDETDVVVEEYEEIVGDLGEFSDRVAMEDAQAVSIQERTSFDRRNLMTHSGRPYPDVYEWKTSRKLRRVEPGGRHGISSTPHFCGSSGSTTMLSEVRLGLLFERERNITIKIIGKRGEHVREMRNRCRLARHILRAVSEFSKYLAWILFSGHLLAGYSPQPRHVA